MAELSRLNPPLFANIVRKIMCFLSVGALFNFMQACRVVGNVGTAQTLWQMLFQRDYGLKYGTLSPNIKYDYYSLYKERHATPFKDGVGIRITCSKDQMGVGSNAIFTTTIYNQNDHSVTLHNQRPTHPRHYESAASFACAWNRDGDKVLLQHALPTYGTYQHAGKAISLAPTGEVTTRELSPHSRTEFSVVGILCEQPEVHHSPPGQDEDLFILFPSHHLKVAEFNSREFWMITKICFEGTELSSNVLKISILDSKDKYENTTISKNANVFTTSPDKKPIVDGAAA
jgi:hypothetical protein